EPPMNADERRLKIRHNPFYFQPGPAEIDQKTNAQSCSLEIIQALCAINIIQCRNRLELYDYTAFHE
ncbi:MAG TPA: hypothetical protein VLT92_17740, partial [Burkholderiales bacterium]|nr:hypothetical protein [Burkholderiales bacterium]